MSQNLALIVNILFLFCFVTNANICDDQIAYFTGDDLGRELIFILDRWPADSTTYFTYLDFAQGVVSQSDRSTRVTYITLNRYHRFNRRYSLVVNRSETEEFGPGLWRQRADRTQEMTSLDEIIKLTKPSPCISIVVVVPYVYSIRKSLKSIFYCPIRPSASYVHNVTVFVREIKLSILRNELSRKIHGFPVCVHAKKDVFRSLQDFKSHFDQLAYELNSFTAMKRVITGSTNKLALRYAEVFTICEKEIVYEGGLERFSMTMVGLQTHIWYPENTTKIKANRNTAWAVCSRHGLKPATMFEKLSFDFYKSVIFEFIAHMSNYTGLQLSEYEVLFGLEQSKQHIGNRFYWAGERELLYSHWAQGEPRDRTSKKCVRWRFKHIGTHLRDMKWHSVGCGPETGHIILCGRPWYDRIRSVKRRFNGPNFSVKSRFGQLIRKKIKNKAEIASMLSIFASGYLQRRWNELRGVTISGLVSGEEVTLTSSAAFHELLEQLRPLFHPCGEKEDDRRGVPLSHVCDGKRDCPSGSDEASCVESSANVCDPDVFQCRSGQCVPMQARCDLLRDCQDGSDEVACELECPHKMCISGRCLPKSLFHDGQIDCEDGDDENLTSIPKESCLFICNRTKCVTKEMLNDGVVDCTGPEGPLDETLGAVRSVKCTSGLTLNNWAPRCVLFRDLYGRVIGCPNLKHLRHCKYLRCPIGYFKCPHHFCIPVSYVRDGRLDCPNTVDEYISTMSKFDNVFWCSVRTAQFVHPSGVCDGRRDCEGGEDELDCGHFCPAGFICLSGAVSAVRYNKSVPLRNLTFIHPDTRYLDLSGVNGVQDFFSIYPKNHLRYLRSFNLSGCEISSILRSVIGRKQFDDQDKNLTCKGSAQFKDFGQMKTLDLSCNKLIDLPGCSYLNLMSGLENLNLSFNARLSGVTQDSFAGLTMLESLDMSFTGISSLPSDVFEDLSSLKSLTLKGSALVDIKFRLPETIEYFNVEMTNIADVGRNVFGEAEKVKEVRSSTYKLCCPQVLGHKIPKHVCHYTEHAITSCTALVEETSLIFLLWLIGLATCVGNSVTLAFRLIWERDLLRKPYGIFVTNLGVSDLLMGVYLMLVAVAERLFYGEYILHDFTWRNGPVCQVAGVLVTMTSLTSLLFISLITVERYLAVKYPFGEVRLSVRTVNVAVTAVWLFGLSAALLPLLPWTQHWEIFSSNGMCVALPLSSKRRPGQLYGATLFVGVDLIFFVFIGVGQTAIYTAVKEQGKRTRKHMNQNTQFLENQKRQEFAVARRLSLIVITDFLCWFPIITMGVMAMSGLDLGDEAYRWSALLVLPINSALNPLLYTVPEIRKKWEDFKAARRQAKKEASIRRRRSKSKTAVKPIARRRLLLRSRRALSKLRRKISARSRQHTFSNWELKRLFSKVKAMRSTAGKKYL